MQTVIVQHSHDTCWKLTETKHTTEKWWGA